VLLTILRVFDLFIVLCTRLFPLLPVIEFVYSIVWVFCCCSKCDCSIVIVIVVIWELFIVIVVVILCVVVLLLLQ
jgi:hypothetical protein